MTEWTNIYDSFAQRQITEAPQGTVVDELVATAAPMGGMPMVGMPMPRPEDLMISQPSRSRDNTYNPRDALNPFNAPNT